MDELLDLFHDFLKGKGEGAAADPVGTFRQEIEAMMARRAAERLNPTVAVHSIDVLECGCPDREGKRVTATISIESVYRITDAAGDTALADVKQMARERVCLALVAHLLSDEPTGEGA